MMDDGYNLQHVHDDPTPSDRHPNLSPFGGCALIISFVGLFVALSAIVVAGLPNLSVTHAILPPHLFSAAVEAHGAPTESHGQRTTGAHVLYRHPVTDEECSILGAIEAGRRYRIVAARGEWSQIDAQGSGTVWVRSRHTLHMEGQLGETVIAYREPRDDGCPVVGVIEPGSSFTVVQDAGPWKLIMFGTMQAWMRASGS